MAEVSGMEHRVRSAKVGPHIHSAVVDSRLLEAARVTK